MGKYALLAHFRDKFTLTESGPLNLLDATVGML